jgi:hypothetical protein
MERRFFQLLPLFITFRGDYFSCCLLFIAEETLTLFIDLKETLLAAVFIILSLHGEETISDVIFVHRMGEDIFSCCLVRKVYGWIQWDQ